MGCLVVVATCCRDRLRRRSHVGVQRRVYRGRHLQLGTLLSWMLWVGKWSPGRAWPNRSARLPTSGKFERHLSGRGIARGSVPVILRLPEDLWGEWRALLPTLVDRSAWRCPSARPPRLQLQPQSPPLSPLGLGRGRCHKVKLPPGVWRSMIGGGRKSGMRMGRWPRVA